MRAFYCVKTVQRENPNEHSMSLPFATLLFARKQAAVRIKEQVLRLPQGTSSNKSGAVGKGGHKGRQGSFTAGQSGRIKVANVRLVTPCFPLEKSREACLLIMVHGGSCAFLS